MLSTHNTQSREGTVPSLHLSEAPRMIGQPYFSILLYFQPFEGLHPTLNLSISLCCLPISFSVCLSFSLLVKCPAGSSLQVPLILLCAHTISVCGGFLFCFVFFHSGEKIFIGPNGLADSVPHFLICNVISVGDDQDWTHHTFIAPSWCAVP